MGQASGAIPAALDRRGNAGGKDRQLRPAAQRHVHSDRVRRTYSGPMGSLRLLERGRAQRSAVRSGMVRRHIRVNENLHGGIDFRCPCDPAWTQPACRSPSNREPVAGSLSTGRIPDPQDAIVLSLRETCTRSSARAFRIDRCAGIRNRTRRLKNRVARKNALELADNLSEFGNLEKMSPLVTV